MTTPNKPPSCDRLTTGKPKLKECPFCGSDDVEFIHNNCKIGFKSGFIACQDCCADGPLNDTDFGTKWNSIPRKSEVKELLRLVENFHNKWSDGLATSSSSWKAVVDCSKKLRKEWGL